VALTLPQSRHRRAPPFGNPPISVSINSGVWSGTFALIHANERFRSSRHMLTSSDRVSSTGPSLSLVVPGSRTTNVATPQTPGATAELPRNARWLDHIVPRRRGQRRWPRTGRSLPSTSSSMRWTGPAPHGPTFTTRSTGRCPRCSLPNLCCASIMPAVQSAPRRRNTPSWFAKPCVFWPSGAKHDARRR